MCCSNVCPRESVSARSPNTEFRDFVLGLSRQVLTIQKRKPRELQFTYTERSLRVQGKGLLTVCGSRVLGWLSGLFLNLSTNFIKPPTLKPESHAHAEGSSL